ncbi:hypothetical protein ACFVXH_28700 [Kitasatospora sp. NPDC058184]|uniref:hypothetical protein n=1 Tax=Kitasatospora sp. NPDC058184 TaxID=3346370 RepID=UPI0036DC90DE
MNSPECDTRIGPFSAVGQGHPFHRNLDWSPPGPVQGSVCAEPGMPAHGLRAGR